MKKWRIKEIHISRDTTLTLRKMKLTLLFSLLLFLSAMGGTLSQSTKNINLQNEPASKCIQTLEEQTGFYFIYEDKVFKEDQKVTIKGTDESIENVIKKIANIISVDYKIFDRQVVFLPKEKKIEPLNLSSIQSPLDNEENLQPQTKVLTGSVLNKDGQPLIGVSIIIKGTTTGVITDIKGSFTLNAPLDAQILVLSYVGMKTQEIEIGKNAVFNIVMEEETVGMEEVVVVGYGMQKKESIVGAISQTSGENIRQNIQGADLGTALSGSIPGLISLRSNGRPGGVDLIAGDDAYSEIFIRGKKTWNDASPLVLVDGVERDFRQINPYEIDKISVLKDASATAVFGVKGANGVILITTLRGQEGKAKMTFDGTVTAKTISRLCESAGAYETLNAYNQGLMSELALKEDAWNFIIPQKWVEWTKDQAYPYYLPDVNWRDEILNDYAVDYTANMTVTGGTKLVKYFGAVDYMEENDLLIIGDIGQGYDPSQKFKRINFRSNLDFNITSTTLFSVNLSGSNSIQRKNEGTRQAWRALTMLGPCNWALIYPDGIYGYNANVHNTAPPLRDLNYGGYKEGKLLNINTDYILNQKLDFITKGLSANARLSYDYRDYNQYSVGESYPAVKYIKRDIVDAITPGMTEAEIKELEREYTIWNFGLSGITHTYDWSLDQNSFGAESSLAGSVYRSLFYQLSLNYGRDFGKHSVSGMALMNRQENATGSVFPRLREDWVGRITYTYDRRYLLETNGAYNGSEIFDRKYRVGFFPSIAVGCFVSNESLFDKLKPVFSNLKVRNSNGTVGSDAGIDRWLYTSGWIVKPEGTGTNRWLFGAPDQVGSYPLRYEGAIPNEDIHWETAKKKDLGIETGFFSNQLTLNFDYFIENRSDIYLTASQRVIPVYFGAPAVSANIGKVDVHGWELETQFKKVSSGGFTYWASYAWSFAKDKVIDRGEPKLKPFYQKSEGYMMDQAKGYLPNHSIMQTWNDVYNYTGQLTSPEYRLPGDFGIVDFNGDGVLDTNDAAPISYASRPQYSYSPALGASYKNWSANLRFFGVYNVAGNVGDYYTWFTSLAMGEPVCPKYLIKESWSPERHYTTSAKRPEMRGFTSMSSASQLQPYFEQSRSYLRLESAEISYSLNRSNAPFLQRMKINNLRLVLSGYNLFLISDMRTDRDAYTSGSVDVMENYPVLKRFSFGINMDF